MLNIAFAAPFGPAAFSHALRALTPPSWLGVLVGLVPAALTLVLLAFVFRRLRQSAEAWTFACMTMALLAWQLSEGLHRLPADLEAAQRVHAVLAFVPALIAAFALHFALFFTGHDRLARSPAIVVGLYLTAFAFIGLDRLELLRGALRRDELWGYSTALPTNPTAIAFRVWMGIVLFSAIALLFLHARRLGRGDPERAQALLLGIGFTVPVFEGLVLLLLFPAWSERFGAPLAPLFTTAFAVTALIALLRHGLLLTPTPSELLAAKEEELQRQREMLRRAEHVAAIGSWEVDVLKDEVRVSDEVHRLLELPRRDRRYTAAEFMARLPAEERREAEDAIREAVQTRKAFRWEHYIVVGDQTRWIEARGQPEFDAHGRLVRIVGVSRDITEQRAAAESDRVALERLLTIRQLQEGNRFRTNLLNTIGHELNTPLTALKLQLYMVRSGQFGATTPKQERALEVVDRNLDRLARLIKDVHEVNRLQHGAFRLRISATDMSDIVRDSVDAFRPQAEEHGVMLRFRDGQPGTIQVDADRLTQTLHNLLSNAIKCSHQGKAIDVDLRRDGDAVVLSVRDEGIGLTERQLAILFQPFGRVHEQGPAAIHGTGLGLYVVREIVSRHGGTVDVHSDGPGKGSTFTIRLPREAIPNVSGDDSARQRPGESLSAASRQGGAS